MPNRPATVEVNISNLSLPLPVLALGSIGDYERYLRSITPSGHDRAPGIEYTTVKSRFGHQLGKLAQIDRGVSPNGKPHTPEEELVARMVRSLHLSFRDESPRGGPAERVFPHAGDSVHQMASTQKVVGRPLRAVLYTRQFDSAADYRSITGMFGARSFQPKPKDFADLWQIGLDPAVETVKEQMGIHGLDDVTPDTVHSISLADAVDRLAADGLVRAVHVSVGRNDLPAGLSSLSMQAKRAFMRSPEAAASTREGDMLLGIFRHWRDQGGDYLATVEMSPGVDPRQARREHQAILETTHGLLQMAKL